MTFNTTSVAVAAVILIGLGVIGGYLLWGGGDNTKPDYLPGEIIVQKDTIYSEKTIHHKKIVPVFTREIVEVERKDSSELEVLKKVAADTIYVASLDTLLYDSLLNLMVKYNSQVPLDQEAYFSLEARLKERRVVQKETIFVEKDEGIIDRWLHFGIVAAAGYGLINQKSDIYIGLGVMIGL
ncbi:MAG: hypothetical protein IPJ75_02080 [Ignavibacteriales bacterium]|nr:hypothetical protein [Ignavibacteriales bacterium]